MFPGSVNMWAAGPHCHLYFSKRVRGTSRLPCVGLRGRAQWCFVVDGLDLPVFAEVRLLAKALPAHLAHVRLLPLVCQSM